MAPLLGLAWLASCTLPRKVQFPWAVAFADTVDAALVCALGGYPVSVGDGGNPDGDPEDIIDLAEEVPAAPNVWTDGSRDEDLDALVGVAGAGAVGL